MKSYLAFLMAVLLVPALLFFTAVREVEAPMAPPAVSPPSFAADSLQAIQINNTAQIHLYRFELDSALLYFQQLEEKTRKLLRHSNDSLLWVLYLDSYFNQGYIHLLSKNYEESKQLLDTTVALTIRRFEEEHFIVTKAYFKLARIHLKRGNIESYCKLVRRGFEIRKKILRDDDIFLIYAYGHYGNVFGEFNDLEKALEQYEKALSLVRGIMEKPDRGLKKIDDIEIPFLSPDTIPILRDLFLKRHFNALWGSHLAVARLNFRLGNMAEATWYFERGNQLRKKLGKPADPSQEVWALFDLAQFKANLGFPEEAEAIVGEALQFIENNASANLQYEKELFYPVLSHIAFQKGDFNRSLEYLLKTRGYNDSKGAYQLENTYSIASLYYRKGCDEEAMQYIEEGLSRLLPEGQVPDFSEPILHPEAGAPAILLDFLVLKGNILRRQFHRRGREAELVAAMQTLKRALALQEQLLSKFLQDFSKITFLQDNYQLTEALVNTAFDLYERREDPVWLREAFSFLEANKAFTLREARKKPAVSRIAGISPHLLDLEEQLDLGIAGRRQRIYREIQKGRAADTALIVRLERELNEKTASRDSLQRKFAEEYPQYYRLINPKGNTSIGEVQEKLAAAPAPVTVIQYFLGDSTLAGFQITADTFSAFRGRPDTHLDCNIRALLQVAGGCRAAAPSRAAPLPGYASAAWRLHSTLFSAFPVPVTTDELIIIPDGKLSNVPFELLLTGPPSAAEVAGAQPLPFLLNEKTIHYEFSSALLLSGSAGRKAGAPYFGIAPFYDSTSLPPPADRFEGERLQRLYSDVTRSDLAPLAFSEPEVSEVKRQLSGAIRTGAAATEQAFKEMAPNYRVLHLAMHALVNHQAPLYSQLIFSEGGPGEDGRLNAYELYNMRFNADLAVLSACNTGAGKIQRGEGVMSLARAFKYAGCDNIVMSLWPVNDASTKDIMVRFFDHLKKGLGKADALRQAKLDFLSDPANLEQQHPYYWAGFVLIGDNEPIAFGDSWRRHRWLLLFGIIGLFPAAFYLRNWLS